MLGVLFGVLILLSLNAAAFHWWLSWGPPSADPQAESRVAIIYLFAAITLLGVGVVLIRSLVPRTPAPRSQADPLSRSPD